jgi:hypothetical protein
MIEDKSIKLTRHSLKRLKERVGLPKKACQKHAEKAFADGLTHSDMKGQAKRYIDKLYLEHRNANNIRAYGEFIFLFKNNTLITVLNKPKNIIIN